MRRGCGKCREGVQVDAEEQDRKKRIDEKLGYKRKSNCISQSKAMDERFSEQKSAENYIFG